MGKRAHPQVIGIAAHVEDQAAGTGQRIDRGREPRIVHALHVHVPDAGPEFGDGRRALESLRRQAARRVHDELPAAAVRAFDLQHQ
jgi:hypothetical protein